MTELKAFSCPNCGTPNPAIQPDDEHVIAKSSPCLKGDSISRNIDCKNCDHRHTIHWDIKHDKYEDDFNRVTIS